MSAEIDERTLREIYLRNFQIVIREANPWSVMSAYNKINGVYASENRWLLTDLLRREWDYDGVVVSDWGAVHDPVEAVDADTDLRMPGRPEDDRLRIAEAAGRLAHEALAGVAQRLALLAERTTPDTHHAPVVDLDHHHQLTRRAAAESAVLLVNDGTLPLNLQTAQRPSPMSCSVMSTLPASLRRRSPSGSPILRRFSTSPASTATYGTARASMSATATTTRDPSEWTIPSATAFPTRASSTPIPW